jgi:hypothetical protein
MVTISTGVVVKRGEDDMTGLVERGEPCQIVWFHSGLVRLSARSGHS